MHACISPYIQTYIHTYRHTDIMHTHTQAQAQAQSANACAHSGDGNIFDVCSVIICISIIMYLYSTALVFCRDSGTEIFVRDYDTPLISAPEEAEPLLDTRPENSEKV